MGGVPTKIRRSNKVDPAVEYFEQQLQHSPTLVTVETKDGEVLWGRPKERQNWEVFDVSLSNKYSKSKMPDKFSSAPPTSGLTKEKIIEKQAQAEKNRLQHLETKKKTAAKFAETRNKKESEDKRITKANQMPEKSAKVADNRKQRLENIRTAAKNSRGAVCVTCRARANVVKASLQLEKKMTSTAQENRERIIEDLVRKQRMREEYARKVGNKAQRLNEDPVYILTDLEVDSNYNASESGENGSDMWNT